jgi:O-antigen/teichoic acid export membrane protein
MLILLYTTRVVLRVLGVVDFGIYNIIGGIVVLVAFINLTISNATQRFLSFELGTGNKNKLLKIFSTVFIIHFLFAGIILILCETVGLWFVSTKLMFPEKRTFAVYFLYHCSVFTLIFNFICIPYNALIIAHEHIHIFAYISILEVLLKLITVFILTYSPFDKLCSYAFILVIVAVIIRIIYGVYCNKHFSECKYHKKYFDKTIFKEILRYTSWTMIGSSSSVLKEQGVNILINIFFGVMTNAARAVSMQIYSAVQSFSNNLLTAIRPQITKSYANGDIARAVDLTILGTKFSSYLLILISLPIFMESDFILTLWLNKVPDYTVVFVKWVLILSLARVLGSALDTLYLAIGKVKYIQICAGGVMLLNLPISYFFLKLGYPPVTTMIIGSIIELIVVFIVLFFLYKIMNFPVRVYTKEVFFKLIVIIGISICFPLYLRNIVTEGWLRFIWVSLSCVASIIISIYFIGLNNRERKKIILFIKKHIKHENH